jgi:ATP-binding cassette subfamily B protein
MYLPSLIFAFCWAAALLHALLLWGTAGLTLGEVIAFMGLVGALRFPTNISIFTFNLVQLGIAGARRILSTVNEETELDENEGGTSLAIQGGVRFEDVSLRLGGASVLRGVTFGAMPGETIAIVGQTGSGKTVLTRLINRIFDAESGRVLVDGVDVRDWSLASLRSQISIIEQDVFLFSKSVAENIGFGVAGATPERIERAAREAQAHDFIAALPNGYNTVIGERGATLSGGQRQRIAIARAFLTDPRILILDDSTSAIDSATEDEIQQAMHRISSQRTTFLITHRLSQIRWADRILVMRRGELVDQGTHDDLMARSVPYRRIFARYEA